MACARNWSDLPHSVLIQTLQNQALCQRDLLCGVPLMCRNWRVAAAGARKSVVADITSSNFCSWFSNHGGQMWSLETYGRATEEQSALLCTALRSCGLAAEAGGLQCLHLHGLHHSLLEDGATLLSGALASLTGLRDVSLRAHGEEFIMADAFLSSLSSLISLTKLQFHPGIYANGSKALACLPPSLLELRIPMAWHADFTHLTHLIHLTRLSLLHFCVDAVGDDGGDDHNETPPTHRNLEQLLQGLPSLQLGLTVDKPPDFPALRNHPGSIVSMTWRVWAGRGDMIVPRSPPGGLMAPLTNLTSMAFDDSFGAWESGDLAIISRLSGLRQLAFNAQEAEDDEDEQQLLQSLGALKSLQRLTVVAPHWALACPGLTRLEFRATRPGHRTMQAIKQFPAKLPKLSHLHAFVCGVTDGVVRELAALTGLTALRFLCQEDAPARARGLSEAGLIRALMPLQELRVLCPPLQLGRRAGGSCRGT